MPLHNNVFITVLVFTEISSQSHIFTVFKTMLKYAQEEYGFKLSMKNVVLPKAERKQVEKISEEQQKKLVSYLKANMSITAFGIILSLFMGLRTKPWGIFRFLHQPNRHFENYQRVVCVDEAVAV